VEHDNGAGQKFYDCNPRDTWTATTAMEAAVAWDAAGASTFVGCASCLGWQTTSACGVWCYAGSLLPGYVNVVPSLSCQCPTMASPLWH
jgi:hypothetical protein